MISHFHPIKFVRVLAVLAAFALPGAVNAQLLYNVSVDTSSLVDNPAGPFSLDFQLNDGSGWGNGNNWASLTNFQFGGGAALGIPDTYGGATGDLVSGVMLIDTKFMNSFTQMFTAGSWLSFDLTLTANVEPDGTPDLFSFAILDGNGYNIPTTSLGSDLLLEINLTDLPLSIGTYGSPDYGIAAPSIVAVPEPATYGLCAGGLLALFVFVNRIRRTRVSPVV